MEPSVALSLRERLRRPIAEASVQDAGGQKPPSDSSPICEPELLPVAIASSSNETKIRVNCKIELMIGKKGSVINYLREATGCEMEVKATSPTETEVTITSQDSSLIRDAINLITNRLHNITVTKRFDCSAGFLIGPNGDNCHRIRIKSSNKVLIKVNARGTTECEAVLTGPQYDISAAETEISAIMNEKRAQNDHKKTKKQEVRSARQVENLFAIADRSNSSSSDRKRR